MCSDLPSPTFQSAGTLAAPCKYTGTGINLKFCLPFPFYYILPPYPLKAFFFFLPSPQKHTNGNCSIWRMVFVAGVVTLSVGVVMVVTNLKGRIQVTIHLTEVPFFSKSLLFNISKKIYTLYHTNITLNHCANLTWNHVSIQLAFNGRKAECKTAGQ